MRKNDFKKINKFKSNKNNKKDISNTISKDKKSFDSFDIFSYITEDEYENKKKLLKNFFDEEKYIPMTKKQIINILGVSKNQEKVLEYILNELENELYVYIDDSKRYIVASKSNLIVCKYEYKSKNFGFGICNDENEDIYIPSDYSLNAMDKDTILVKILEGVDIKTTSVHRKIGRVEKVLRHNKKTIIGRYIKSRNFGFVETVDNKLEDIYIPKRYSNNANDGDFVEVQIEKYPTKNSRAEGKITSKVADKEEPNNYVKALRKVYDLDEKLLFKEISKQELDNIPEKVFDEEYIGRIDRRKERTYTIDSYDAMDLDDAISISYKDNKYILSVYIADVSHYVKEGTQIEKAAFARATSIYIPGTVVPMLPKKLSNGICSLNAGVDRLAMGVDITIEEDGRVIDSNIFKAVINVNKKMTYTKVLDVINYINDNVEENKKEQNDESIKEYKEYIDDIKLMYELSMKLKKRRKEEGSIEFDIPETKVLLDENRNLIGIGEYKSNEATELIEQFMVITNIVIAERFFFLHAPFIYRIHEKPDEEKLVNLNLLLSNYKKRIKNINNIHPKMLSEMIDTFENAEEKAVVSKFMLRTLKLARYSNECVGHFGLAAKYYCHFTSPIRRYPDLFIHRVISKYIESNYLPEEKQILKYEKISEKAAYISSEMEKESVKIERDFEDLYKAMYMEDKVGGEYDGIISSITNYGMFVKLENTIEGMVTFDNLGNDYYIYDEKNFRLIGERTKKIFKIGDRVNIKVTRVDIKLRQIDFKII